MFEICHNLTELNEERVRLYKEQPSNIREINNQYNMHKKALAELQESYKQLKVFMPIINKFEPVSQIPVAGTSPKINSIIMTQVGFLI